MRIIIDNGEYWLQNKGDLAMLDVTVGRLRERWPDARIGVPTWDPAMLRSYEPRAEPLAVSDGGDWPTHGLPQALAASLPPRVVGPVTRGWRETTDPARRLVRSARGRIRGDRHNQPRPAPKPSWPDSRPQPRVPRAVESASLVMALGGGYLADVDRNQSHRTLDLFERAAELGIPTAMMGQGIGPMQDPVLVERARDVLPRVDLIAVREPVNGPPLLTSLGVSPDRIVVTGDDAVELAYDLRAPQPGNGVGVALRIAEYSVVAAGTSSLVRSAVQAFARQVSAPLVPMAVSTYLDQDRRTTWPLVSGYRPVVGMLGRYSSARELARRVSECAVVVTGAYHLAVFALSQGIPVVALSTSRYYDHKFVGLEHMFGPGVIRVSLRGDDVQTHLLDAMHTAWGTAPDLRAGLLAAAVGQIEASRAAYARMASLVPSGSPGLQ